MGTIRRAGLAALLFFSACTEQSVPAAREATAAAAQAIVGNDGVVSVSTPTVLNQYAVLGANAAAGASSIQITAAGDLDSATFGPLAAGDLLMIIQMQGATIDATDALAYGNVTTLNGAGLHELVEVASVAGATITLNNGCGGLKNAYATAGNTQVVRVPQLTDLTVTNTGTVTAPAWDGQRGGIVALHVQNTLALNGTIDVSGLGFRGGTVDNTSQAVATDVAGYRSAAAGNGGEKGEGIAGSAATYDGLNGRYGRGAPANAGGGGNSHNAGGGGGANAASGAAWSGQGVMDQTAIGGAASWPRDPGYIAINAFTTSQGGGRGGYSTSTANRNAATEAPGLAVWGGNLRRERGGLGGRPLASDPASRLFFGGGGGAGDGDNASAGAGGRGGGFIYLMADTVTGPGALVANGNNGASTVAPHNDAAGGGGAGGTIALRANAVTGFSVSTNGGAGGNQLIASGLDEAQGPGGGGSGGYVAITALSIPSPTNPTRSAAGGPNGSTSSNGLTEFPANGATRGNAGSTAGDVVNVPLCLAPVDLQVTVDDATTNQVPGTNVTWTITVTNAGPGTATRARLVDNFPATMSGMSWTCSGAGGATCASPGPVAGNINAFVTMPPGSTVTFTATGLLAATATVSLANTATIYTPPTINDSNLLNNVATDTDTLGPIADLSLVVTDAPDPVNERANYAYSATLTNLGPSTAATVSVSLPLPTGTTFVSASGTGWACALAAGTVTCTRATLNPGAAPVITVTLTAPTSPSGTTLNTTVTAGAATPDPAAGNNTVMVSTAVAPVNDAPVNAVPIAQLMTEDSTLIFSLANGNQISTSDVDALAPAEVRVTLSASTGTLTLGSTAGLSSVVGDGTATVIITGPLPAVNACLNGLGFTPALNFNGPATVSITTNDQGNTGAGGARQTTDVIAVTVTPVNDPPTAVNDSIMVTEDSVLNPVMVLTNDTALPDTGETLTVVAVGAAAHGLVSGGGMVVFYTPNPNYFGPDVFTYTISDGNGATAMAQVSVVVTAVNDPPTALDDAFGVVEGSMNNVMPVLANDSIAPDVMEILSVTAVSAPSHGTAAVNAAGANVIYTPAAGYSGTDTFTYTVTDSGGASATATVTVTIGPVNNAPTNVVPGPQTLAEDTTLTFNAAGSNVISVADVDANAAIEQLSLNVTRGTLSLSTLTGLSFAVGDGTDDQSIVCTGTLAAINAALDGLLYRPPPNVNGSATLTVVSNDLGNTGVGGAKSATSMVALTITPVNDPPTAVDDSFTVPEDSQAVLLPVLTNDSIAPDTGETLVVSQVTQPTHGSVTIAPNGTGVNYTPTPLYFGPDSFTYTANDGNGGTAVATVSVMVVAVEHPPTLRDDLFTVAQGSTANVLDVLANDSAAPDVGQTLKVIAVSLPRHGAVVISSMGADVTYTPTAGYFGPDDFAYTVQDSGGSFGVAQVLLTVGADQDRDGLSDAEELVLGTDPTKADTDGDGLDDGLEVKLSKTNPLDDDTDDDGLMDGSEDANHNGAVDPGETDPRQADTDNDGLQDGTELGLTMPQGKNTTGSVFQPDLDPASHTNPLRQDTDGGGDGDGVEDVNHNGRIDSGETNPNDPLDDRRDSDRDGVPDAIERTLGLNPNDADSDDDGLLDGADGTKDSDGDGKIDALDSDSDGDGILDGTEEGVTRDAITADTDLAAGNFVADADPGSHTSHVRVDSDGDGLNDGAEDVNHDGKRNDTETDAAKGDTDGDGLSDFVELTGQNPTNPLVADTDGDTLTDGAEDANANGQVDPGETDPNQADSDHGGTPDGHELEAGRNPLDPSDDYVVRGGGGCASTSGQLSVLLTACLGLLALRRRPLALKSRARRTGRSLLGLGLALMALALLAPRPAAAQSSASEGFDAQRFHLAPGAYDFANVYSSDVTKHLQINAQLWATYASQPMVLADPLTRQTSVRLVEDQTTFQLVAGIGIKERLDLNLVLPITVQRGQSNEAVGSVSGTGVGDLKLVPKVLALRFKLPLTLSFALPITFPTGNASQLRGNGSFGVTPMAIGQLTLPVIRVAANLGVDVRAQRQLLGLTSGSGLTWGVAALAPIMDDDRLGALLTLTGDVAFSSSLPESRPVDALLGLRLRFVHWAFDLGVGTGLNAGAGNPRWRVVGGLAFLADPIVIPEKKKAEPVPDQVEPPEERAVVAQFAAAPVVIKPDADGDGVSDDADQCPAAAETINGIEDGDGCPDQGRVNVTIKDNAVEFSSKLTFGRGNATPTVKTTSLLQQLALTLKTRAAPRRLRIEVYTTEGRDADGNITLSQRRANKILSTILEEGGIDPARLDVVGLGGQRPFEDNVIEVLIVP